MSLEVHNIDQGAILRHLNLKPDEVSTQALLLICQRYGLDPLMKHVVLISGRPYVTRDGYLHIAHASEQLDGIELVEEGETADEWWAKVAVHRKDMSRPFTYRGRYPKDGQQKKYGPEMAVKTAEVMAMRRAFDVTGIAAADEQWDDVVEAQVVEPQVVELATPATADVSIDLLRNRIDNLPPDYGDKVMEWLKKNGVESIDLLPSDWDDRVIELIEKAELAAAEDEKAKNPHPADDIVSAPLTAAPSPPPRDDGVQPVLDAFDGQLTDDSPTGAGPSTARDDLDQSRPRGRR
jgi:hypothetical protein